MCLGWLHCPYQSPANGTLHKLCIVSMSASAASAASAPPKPPVKPAVKPKNLKFVRALFGYSAKDQDELSFLEGDLLYIIDDKSDQGWWRAR